MNFASWIPSSIKKSVLIAIVCLAAGWSSKGILSQNGKVINLGNGATLTITQEMVDKGTNAVEIAKQKAIAAINDMK